MEGSPLMGPTSFVGVGPHKTKSRKEVDEVALGASTHGEPVFNKWSLILRLCVWRCVYSLLCVALSVGRSPPAR